ncbi:MAG: thioredoxin family protein [Alphaproteobacteria bacterium]|nr:thioredoxin family protein [Alphaproteobacteria bacterium]
MAALTTPSAQHNFLAIDFKLKGVDDRFYTLRDIQGEKGTLIMFICNHCPYVKAIIDRIVRDVKELDAYGVKSVAIMSNDYITYPDDNFENMKQFARLYDFTFPYLLDETQEVAKAYDAVCTPEFYGFDQQNILRYRGRLDASRREAIPEAKRDLFDAMVEISTFNQAPIEQFPSMGCSIKWK